MVTSVWIRVQLPGFHRWPGATGVRAYLSQRHRHLFHLEVQARVSHDDRDIEFHDLQDEVRNWWGASPREWDSASCEAIAHQLWAHLEAQDISLLSITVSEDGECGATLTIDK